MRIIAITCLIFGLTVSSCNRNQYNYKIKNYILTLEPRVNTNDVNACIEITYVIDGTSEKSDGFKFIGECEADSLICFDETGEIKSKVEYLRETKLTWFFNPIKAGKKTIKAHFILRNFLTARANGRNEIYAPWAGVFRVPVDKARYNIIVNSPYTRVKCKEPEQWNHVYKSDIDYYTYNQSPLTEKSIKVRLEN